MSFLIHRAARTRNNACMGSYKYVCAVYVHILIVYSKCEAIGSFLACIYPFRCQKLSFLIHRAAREITLICLVICRADLCACMHGSYK